MTSQYKILYTPFRETRTKKREREKKENLVENKGKREAGGKLQKTEGPVSECVWSEGGGSCQQVQKGGKEPCVRTPCVSE